MKKILKTTEKQLDTTGGTWNGLIDNTYPITLPIDDIQVIKVCDSNGVSTLNPANFLNGGLPTYAADAETFKGEGFISNFIIRGNWKNGYGLSGNTYGAEAITGTSTSDISNDGVVTDTNADFIADGVKPGDAFFNGGQYCIAIKSVDSPTQLTLYIRSYPNPANEGGLTANDYVIYKNPMGEVEKLAEFVADANNDNLEDVIYEKTFNIANT